MFETFFSNALSPDRLFRYFCERENPFHRSVVSHVSVTRSFTLQEAGYGKGKEKKGAAQRVITFAARAALYRRWLIAFLGSRFSLFLSLIGFMATPTAFDPT